MRKYIFFSIIFHLLLLLSLIYYSTPSHSIGKKTIVIPAWVETYSSAIFTPQSKSSEDEKAVDHSTKNIQLGIPKNDTAEINLNSSMILTKKETHSTKNNKSKKALSIKGDQPFTKFLQIIHREISAHQHYPSSAILLNQTGTVILRFNIYPNGQIDQTIIVKSSGFVNLDQAALEALQSISHFENAHLYLKKATTFSVDVIFA